MMKQLISLTRHILRLLIIGLSISSAYAEPAITESTPVTPYTAAGSFVALNYHEARDDVRDYPDPYAVDSSALVMQFSWLKGNGYTPVSLSQIIAARRGGEPLPAKAVLLTFDDAYLSFYTRVYPLLREFNYPAVLGVVGKWIDQPQDGPMMYGEKGSVSTASFPSWKQLREMADSGLVELASHTYDLHRGIRANPQENEEPAATTRLYDTASNRYETNASWYKRVRNDLAKNSDLIASKTGYRPRAVVWPYGSYNHTLVNIAADLDMPITMTLDDGVNTPATPLNLMRRILVQHNPSLSEFAGEMHGPQRVQPVRVVQVNLDDIYNVDTQLQEQHLSTLLNRIQILQPTHIFLQATHDSNADGIADAAYFPNHALPLRADLFNRVAWQLATRVDVQVFAVMPVTGFDLPPENLIKIYADLARGSSFDGLVFEDQENFETLNNADRFALTQRLASTVRESRAPLHTVLSVQIKTPAISTSRSSNLPSPQHDLAILAANYDYVALAISPTTEHLTDADQLLNNLRIANSPEDQVTRRQLIFMFNNSPQLVTSMTSQMRLLQLGKLFNFGFGADDFLQNQPPLNQIAPVMSLREYPIARARKETNHK